MLNALAYNTNISITPKSKFGGKTLKFLKKKNSERKFSVWKWIMVEWRHNNQDNDTLHKDIQYYS